MCCTGDTRTWRNPPKTLEKLMRPARCRRSLQLKSGTALVMVLASSWPDECDSHEEEIWDIWRLKRRAHSGTRTRPCRQTRADERQAMGRAVNRRLPVLPSKFDDLCCLGVCLPTDNLDIQHRQLGRQDLIIT